MISQVRNIKSETLGIQVAGKEITLINYGDADFTISDRLLVPASTSGEPFVLQFMDTGEGVKENWDFRISRAGANPHIALIVR